MSGLIAKSGSKLVSLKERLNCDPLIWLFHTSTLASKAFLLRESKD